MIHPDEVTLLRYAAGEIAEGRSAVADHLAACVACRSLVGDARQVTAALRAIPVPPPSGALIERVLVERDAGMRVERSRVVHTSTIATLVVGLIVGAIAGSVGQGADRIATFAELPLWPWTAPDTAPGPAAGVAPPITRIDARRMRSGRWTYLSRVFADSVLWATPWLSTVTIDSTGAGPAASWVVVRATPGGEVDSLVIDRRRLAPVWEQFHSPSDRLRAAWRFTRDSAVLDMWVPRHRYPDGHIGVRTRHAGYAIEDSTRITLAGDAEFRLFFRTVALTRSWRGRLTLINSGYGESPVTADLSVAGRRTITTPIGRSDCWRVVLSAPGRHPVLWVRAADGIVVKTEEGQSVSELVAEDVLPD
jgi:hypothetical protein